MARDKRPYVPVDVGLPTNRKVVGLHPAAKWLYAAGLLWSGQQLSDGMFRLDILRAVAEVPAKYAAELIERGLWHDKGHSCPDCPQPADAGELVIHDWLEHNRSAAQVRDIRNKRAEAGRAANHKRHGHVGEVGECSKCLD